MTGPARVAHRPLALRDHPEIVALSKTVQTELKADGNASLKSGDHEGAIRLYSHCIALDDAQPVYYSNRSAVYQASSLDEP